MITLDLLLAKEKIHCFDYLSIDVEGLELSVLEGLNLNKYQPSLILTEYPDQSERQRIIEHLRHFGYFILEDNRQDLFFIRKTNRNIFFKIIFHVEKNVKNTVMKIIRMFKKHIPI